MPPIPIPIPVTACNPVFVLRITHYAVRHIYSLFSVVAIYHTRTDNIHTQQTVYTLYSYRPLRSLWSITQTRATYGGLCGMPACGHALGYVVAATRRSSGVTPRACVRVYARVLVPPNLYIHIHKVYTARERTQLHN